MNNLFSIIDKITEKLGLEKEIPDLHGVCNCGYNGYFKFKGVQLDSNNKPKFNLYDCPKCETTISGNTLMNNLYKEI